jgi:hypothetical protein
MSEFATRDQQAKAMEKEIGEGKRICQGVLGTDLDEGLPLRKVILFTYLYLFLDDSQIGRRTGKISA